MFSLKSNSRFQDKCVVLYSNEQSFSKTKAEAILAFFEKSRILFTHAGYYDESYSDHYSDFDSFLKKLRFSELKGSLQNLTLDNKISKHKTEFSYQTNLSNLLVTTVTYSKNVDFDLSFFISNYSQVLKVEYGFVYLTEIDSWGISYALGDEKNSKAQLKENDISGENFLYWKLNCKQILYGKIRGVYLENIWNSRILYSKINGKVVQEILADVGIEPVIKLGDDLVYIKLNSQQRKILLRELKTIIIMP